MFSLRPVLKSLAVLAFLFPSLSVFAQQEEESDNSLFLTNYNAMREEEQGFYLVESSSLFEKPDSEEGSFVAVEWWCDLNFSPNDATSNYGYVGRAVIYFLGSTLEDIVGLGGQIPSSKKQALAISAVLVPTIGIFEGQVHDTRDDWSNRFWDDGSSTLPLLAWEGHDEGDTSLNSNTSAWSSSGAFTKITTDEAAKYLGMDVADMTPATFSTEYEAAWNATHVPDPIDTNIATKEEELMLRVGTIEKSLVAAEEDVAQLQADNEELQADNKELMLRVTSIEEFESLATTAKNTGSGTIGTVVVAVFGLVALELL